MGTTRGWQIKQERLSKRFTTRWQGHITVSSNEGVIREYIDVWRQTGYDEPAID
jgi:hypothetical protein